jgi:hypothetical protein
MITTRCVRRLTTILSTVRPERTTSSFASGSTSARSRRRWCSSTLSSRLSDEPAVPAAAGLQRARRRGAARSGAAAHVDREGSPRFERGGFTLQILDAQNQPIPNSQFATDSNGRHLPGHANDRQELSSPVQNVQPRSIPFTMQHLNEQLHVVNQCRRTLPTAAHALVVRRRERPTTARAPAYARFTRGLCRI